MKLPLMIHGLRWFGLSLALAGALAGCDTMPTNRLLDSVHQPIVEHSRYQLDLATGPFGLGPENRGRLDGWFSALGLRYGDRIAIDDPLESPQTRAEVKSIAADYGMLIGPAALATAGPTTGTVNAGTVRITVLRATASVPHCPDLATKSDSNFNNATSSNYGCAINGNIAAMVANPDDLLSGAHGQTLTNSDTTDKAIWLHQSAAPTGQAGVAKNSTN
ncbi:MAG: CpaD family pilus assembly protein [Pseudomonadota bacterium]|nr:CpaD family pilus assembly protein [Pseudomonadota bacterium]